MALRVVAALIVLVATPGLAFGLGPGLSFAQDDAGSGRDAGATPATSVEILPGTRYLAAIAGALGDDHEDWYAFEARAGMRLELRWTGAEMCATVLDAGAATLWRAGCVVYNAVAGPITLNATGAYYLRFVAQDRGSTDVEPQPYSFGIGLDAAAPGAADSALASATSILDPVEARRPARGADGLAGDAVIALVDDGINPYHAAFRDGSPRASQHPSTYLEGYPADAEPIDITFGHATIEDALRADCDEWSKVAPGKLYYFPGTRIVGGIFLSSALTRGEGEGGPIGCSDLARHKWGGIFGSSTHGTMTASRAAANEYGACPACLLVMVQGYGIEQVRWASEQTWIDVQSDSWGPLVPAYVPASSAPTPSPYAVADPALVRAVEEAALAQPSFWATGNGAAFRLGVVGHPTQATPHLGPSAIRIGGHDSGRVALWPGSSPHVVSDACASWAAVHESMDLATASAGNGTSAATPYAAGLAAQLLRVAREALGDTRTGNRGDVLAQGDGPRPSFGPLADGTLTRREWLDVLFRTADPRPDRIDEDGRPCTQTNEALTTSPPLAWSAVPYGPMAIPLVGYGALTPDTIELASRVLSAEKALPPRAWEDTWFSLDARARAATYQAYVAPESAPLG